MEHPDISLCHEKIVSFLRSLKDKNINGAYRELLKGSIVERKKEEVELLKKKTVIALDTYGAALGHDCVSESCYGQTLAKLIYVMKFERYPITWEFMYYRAHTTWKLISMRFSDQFDLLTANG